MLVNIILRNSYLSTDERRGCNIKLLLAFPFKVLFIFIEDSDCLGNRFYKTRVLYPKY